MFGFGAVRPEGVTQLEPGGGVARRRGSNSDHRSSRAFLTAAIATIATISLSGVMSMASLFPQELVLTKERPHLAGGVDAAARWPEPPFRHRVAPTPREGPHPAR